MKPLAQRITDASMPEPNSGCWIWMGYARGNTKGGDPYGYVAWPPGPNLRAHRASYIAHKGPIPSGILVCHRCDNSLCVNPDHLFLGTPDDNNKDRQKKGRSARGLSHGRTKLTVEQVMEIKAGLAAGRSSYYFAKRYGVAGRTIRYIRDGINWAHLKTPPTEATV